MRFYHVALAATATASTDLRDLQENDTCKDFKDPNVVAYMQQMMTTLPEMEQKYYQIIIDACAKGGWNVEDPCDPVNLEMAKLHLNFSPEAANMSE